MATEDRVTQLNHFRLVSGARIPIMAGDFAGYEAASQSWKAGSPLKTSSGRLQQSAEDDVAGIIGFAVKDASGTTDTRVDFYPAVPGMAFECNLEDGTSGDLALAKSHLYGQYSFAKTAGGLWYADQADTSNKAIFVLALIDPIGTVQGRVLAVLLDTTTPYND